MSTKTRISRKDFLKGVGALMGAAGLSAVSKTGSVSAASTRLNANGLTIRKRGDRYPWWVKTVNQITTELDPAIAKRPTPMGILGKFATDPQELVAANQATAKAHVLDGIVNNTPGRSLPDVALHYAAQGYHTTTVGSFDNRFDSAGPNVKANLESWLIHPPQYFGLPAWDGSPEENSKLVNAAGTQLGAAQVGITAINLDWAYKNVIIDPDATSPANVDGMMVIPESYKYIIVVAGEAPRDLTTRGMSELGATGDRMGYARSEIATTNLIRFIRGLGYGTTSLGPIAPAPAAAIYAGIGELGRMNRMISPIFGGNLRLSGILTDLPLAIDQPIDFGLQEFCKECKICATSCPAGAISMADEPTWETFNEFQTPGKKAYFEDNQKCFTWAGQIAAKCNACLASCPWSKMDKTALHTISKVLSSKVPAASGLLTQLDEAFGYGLVEFDSEEMADWWDLDIPTFGVDSYQGKG